MSTSSGGDGAGAAAGTSIPSSGPTGDAAVLHRAGLAYQSEVGHRSSGDGPSLSPVVVDVAVHANGVAWREVAHDHLTAVAPDVVKGSKGKSAPPAVSSDGSAPLAVFAVAASGDATEVAASVARLNRGLHFLLVLVRGITERATLSRQAAT